MLTGIFKNLWMSPVIAGWTNRLVGVARLVVLTPVVLHFLSPLEVAVYFSLFTVSIFANLVGDRIVVVCTRLLSFAYGGMELQNLTSSAFEKAGRVDKEPHWDSFRVVFETLRTIQIYMALPLAILGSSFAFFIIGKLTGWNSGYHILWLCLAIVTLSVLWRQLSTCYRGALLATLLVRECHKISFIHSLFNLILSILVLYSGGGLLGVILVQAIVEFSQRVSIRVYAKKRIEEINFDQLKLVIDKRIWGFIKRPLFRAIASTIALTGVIRFSNVLIANEGQEALMASYLLCQNLLNSSFGFTVSYLNTTSPYLARALAQNNSESLKDIIFKRIIVGSILTLSAAMALTILGPWLVKLAQSETTWLPYREWILFAFLNVWIQLSSIFESTHNVTNEERFFKRTIIGGLCVVALLPLMLFMDSIMLFIVITVLPMILAKEFYPVRSCIELINSTLSDFLKNLGAYSISMIPFKKISKA